MPDSPKNLDATTGAGVETTPRETEAEHAPREEGAGAMRAASSSPGSVARRRDASEPARAERFSPLLELTLARLRETVREPEIIFWILVFPILLTFALGIAFRNTAPEKVRVALEMGETSAGGDMSAAASTLADALSRSDEIEVLKLSPAEAAQALRSGRVALVVRPSGAGDVPTVAAQPRASTGAPHAFDYRYDPTRPESRLARLVADNALQRALGRADAASAGEERVTEPGARYIDFLIPGLLGMNLMGSGLWGVGFGVVTARMNKLLKRMVATPMRRSHYLLSFGLSRLIFLSVEVGVVVAFALVAFGYSVRGSFAAMTFLLLVGSLTFAGIGLLVGSRARTFEGASGLINLVMMPMWLLSGTFFSSARFPAVLQPFIKALPLTALNDALRAVMNEGATLASNWLEITILLAWCVVSFALALRLFRWQ